MISSGASKSLEGIYKPFTERLSPRTNMSTTAITGAIPTALYAELLDVSFTLDLSAALWAGADVTLPAYDCSASYMIETSAARAVFNFFTNDLKELDTGSDALQFGINVDADKYATFTGSKPVNALCLDGSAVDFQVGELNVNKNMVAHDFVRYLALSLFSNAKATDLFSNQQALLNSIRTAGAAGWTAAMTALDTSGGSIDPTSETDPMLGTDNDKAENVSYQLFKQIIKADPKRFHDLSNVLAVSEEDHPGIYSIPFTDGDSIAFKVTIHPAEGQEFTTNDAATDKIPPRVYLVNLLCVADGAAINATVDPDEALSE